MDHSPWLRIYETCFTRPDATFKERFLVVEREEPNRLLPVKRQWMIYGYTEAEQEASRQTCLQLAAEAMK